MADYYPPIARSIAGLNVNAPGESRRSVYERARAALITRLRSVDPPLSESEITRERLSLEEAIRRVETEAAQRARDSSRAGAPRRDIAAAADDPGHAAAQDNRSARKTYANVTSLPSTDQNLAEIAQRLEAALHRPVGATVDPSRAAGLPGARYPDSPRPREQLEGQAKRAFISYAWETRDHRQWVKELAVRLRLDGVDVILDQWALSPGDQLPEFMESSVRTSDAVLVICTPIFSGKSDARAGGVGYEGSVITAEILSGAARRKFIPLLRRGEWKEAAPSWLLGSVYLNFRNDADQLEESYSELLVTLHGRREVAPPVGSPRFPTEHRRELPVANGDQQLERRNVGDLNNPAWPHVWKTLMDANPHDSDLAHLGRRWLLQNSQDNPSWTFVWKTLMDANPHDTDLAHLGREWLLQNP